MQNNSRVLYRLRIQEYLINKIFIHQEKAERAQLHALIEQNTFLLGVNSFAFVYKGKMYSLESKVTPETNTLIHPDMLDKIIDFIDSNKFDREVMKNRIENLIRNIIVHARTKEDLLQLLPEKIHDLTDLVRASLFDEGVDMTPEEVDEFKQRNHKGYQALKRMFFMYMLTGK